MAMIEITGWRPGFQKVTCTKLLQSAAGLGLAEAKHVTDAVVAGQPRVLQLPSDAEAEELAATLQELGAEVHVLPAA